MYNLWEMKWVEALGERVHLTVCVEGAVPFLLVSLYSDAVEACGEWLTTL